MIDNAEKAYSIINMHINLHLHLQELPLTFILTEEVS